MLEPLFDTATSVVIAVLPLAVLFLLFQVLFLDLPVREVKRILTGTPAEVAASRGSLADPSALDAFERLARARR